MNSQSFKIDWLSSLDSVDSISSRPYGERQFVVVVDDSMALAEKAIKFWHEPGPSDWLKGSARTITIQSGESTLAIVNVSDARTVFKPIDKLRQSGFSVMTLGKSQARAFRFPPAHPRKGMLYVGHPTISSIYYTTSQFHRFTFEHKFSEAIDLLMALGANKISVEHQLGWSRDFAATAGAPISPHGGNLRATASTSSKSRSQLLFKAVLKPKHASQLPPNSAWYDHEPTWQQIAKGRLEHGLKDFSLILKYDDDFGVNAGLKIAALRSGLDIGGKFEDHVSTSWKIQGTFADIK